MVNMIALILLFASSFIYGEGFVAGTFVKTPEGYTRIEDLQVDDYIVSLDKDKNRVTSRVTAVLSTFTQEWFTISLDGFKIIAAPDQKFYDHTHSKWVLAKELDLGHFVMCLTGERHIVSDHAIARKEVRVYTIHLDKYHNFCVTTKDIVVHNVIPLIVWGVGGIAFAGWDTIAVATVYTVGTIAAGMAVNKVMRDAGANGGVVDDWTEAARKIPPGYNDEWTKRRGGPGFVDPDGNLWTPDMKHRNPGPRNIGPHWDVADPDGNKIKEVNDDGTQIWPDGPKNKNKNP